MKSKDLLLKLSDLECVLNAFSYEELKANEAKNLKQSFDRFKEHVENHLWPNRATVAIKSFDHIAPLPSSRRVDNDARATGNKISGESLLKGNPNPNIEDMASTEEKINGDLTALLETHRGDLHNVKELVLRYRQNALEFVGASKLHLKNGDLFLLKRAAEKMKNALTMIGTYRQLEIVVQIHELCENITYMDRIKYLGICFMEEFIIVDRSIEKVLQEMENG